VSGSISNPSSRRRGALESAPAKLKAEGARRRGRVRRIAAVIGGGLLALLVGTAVGFAIYAHNLQGDLGTSIDGTRVLDVPLAKRKPQEPYNMLVMGFDKRPEESVFRSDTMMLAHVDPETKQVWILSLPRDLRVNIPGEGIHKLNQAYALGQETLAIKTVEELTGVPIHHFVAIDFAGFRNAVDAIGGVWVDVPTEIDDWQADASPNRRSKHIDPGPQLLDGERALTFVRSRKFPDGDFTRMENQQRFMLALADQVANKTNVLGASKMVSAIAPYVSTDMSLIELIRTAQALRGIDTQNSIYTKTIPGKWKSPYVYADEEEMAELLKKLRAGVPFESEVPTGTVLSENTAKKPSDVKVSVRNGGGVSGSAGQAASILRSQNFDVVEVGNANQFIYKETLVVYNTDLAAADLVASALPPGIKKVQSRGMYSYQGEILVVIGKDWDLSRVPVAPVKDVE